MTGNSSEIKRIGLDRPTLYAVLYDPRLSFEDLDLAFSCGLLGWTDLPTLASNTFTITDVTHTTDRLGKIRLPADHPQPCRDLMSRVYALESPGYTTYKYHLTSLAPFHNHVSEAGTEGEVSCVMQILVTVASLKVTSETSVHGISKWDIVNNLGALVGALTYIGGYLDIFKE
jgi:hypothetical protein